VNSVISVAKEAVFVMEGTQKSVRSILLHDYLTICKKEILFFLIWSNHEGIERLDCFLSCYSL